MPACSSFDAFSKELRRAFGLGRGGPDASCPLMGMRQGNWSVADFAIDFCTRAHKSSWDPLDLCGAIFSA